MDAKELARSACRIFGHQWGATRYRAYRDPFEGKLTITKARTCKRCGETQKASRT